jgi:TldD protein
VDTLKATIEHLKKRGVDYADIRLVETRHQGLGVRNGLVERCVAAEDRGFGIRVLHKGAWGFAASAKVAAAEMRRAADRAIDVARGTLICRGKPVRLAPLEPAVGAYRTPVKEDPFRVPLEDRLALLLRASEIMARKPQIKLAEGSMDFFRTRKTFASTEGAAIAQDIWETGAGIQATAVDGEEAQARSYPNSHGGQWVTGGYEAVVAMDLVGHAERVREEALALMAAPDCPAGRTAVILDGPQMALQVHESCGHPIELDRVLGFELSFAGGSFLTLDKRNRFQYGSPLVHIVGDATTPGGLGTFGYDDEGVKAQRFDIVRGGLFVNYLASRETAASLGLPSNGCMRADGWNRIPLIRMVNINLEPGTWTLDDLIRDTEDGLYLSINKSWSIDQLRLNFQFGCQWAQEIKGGRLGRLYKNPIYTGMTPAFWNACDAICNRDHWVVWGVPNCGKGEPVQTARVGHGAAPARFRDVQVGAGEPGEAGR